jgi:hypothetical protein
MVKEYFEAANKVSELAENCDDTEAAKILKAGCIKITKLANKLGGIIKTASKKQIKNKAKSFK